MNTVEPILFGDFEWDSLDLRRSQLVKKCSGGPEVFRKRVIRPRPSRRLKLLGALVFLASLVWLVGFSAGLDLFPAQNGNLTWSLFLSCLASVCGLYGGCWLWLKGRNRRR